MTAVAATVWTEVCPLTALTPERGVAALIDDTQVAIYLTFDTRLFAIGNVDPFSGSAVLSRGIVGTRGTEPTVASPLLKQVFSLASGICLDDETKSVPTYPVRVRDGIVEVSVGMGNG